MAQIESRIAALESARGTVGPKTIIVRFMAIKGEKELKTLYCGDERWHRTDDETEQQFVDRASAEVERNPAGLAVLMEAFEPSTAQAL